MLHVMSEKNFQEYPYQEDDFDLYDDEYPVSSNTECTGLIPTAACDPAKVHSYGEIYNIPLEKDEQEPLKEKKKRAPGNSVKNK